MDRANLDTQHIGLATAAATAYIRVTGKHPDGRRDARTQQILDKVAEALAALAPIHSGDSRWYIPRKLLPVHLLGARFAGGGHAVTLLGGLQFGDLTIQRGDLEKAIQVLKARRFAYRWD